MEAGLPEVAGAALADVDGLGVAAVDAAHEDGEGVFAVGDCDEVDVVGHEAVGEEADAAGVEVFAEELQVEFAVAYGEEDVLAVGSALGDVIGQSGGDDSRISWHA
ncbi:MAG: hypothetical protein RL328_786 [Acidobacteriota bacterium]